MNLVERFWSRVDKANDCWVWTGAKTPKGYGKIYSNSKCVYTHRVSWELANENVIPEGIEVCHHCDNPSCVRPEHLFLGTSKDNRLDSMNKGRATPPPPSDGMNNGRAK